MSQRNLQRRDKSGWFRAKSLDTYGPIGPQVVLTEDIGNPQSLDIQCRLNQTVVQSSNTRNMIFSIPEIISFVSSNVTLMPGDIIVTGTPSGVGPLKHGAVQPPLAGSGCSPKIAWATGVLKDPGALEPPGADIKEKYPSRK